MKKIVIIAFIILAGVFFLAGKFTGETKLFADELPANVNETNDLKEITIYEVKPSGKPKSITLTKKEDMAKVIKAGKATELKEADEFVNDGYLILFQGSNENYTMTVDKEGHIDMDGHEEHYEMKGENKLFQTIQSFEGEWEVLDDEEM